MSEYKFGANILENLTTGMYKDSKVIYREYIQNACDQIDQAEQLGILKPRNAESKYSDLGQGTIDIYLNPEARRIVIEDNATGIKAAEFERILSNIADSDKVMGKDKGFRGIGRLCGLAYCKKLVFTSRYSEESVVSIMTCDALTMRDMLNETNNKVRKHLAIDVLKAMIQFSSRTANEDDQKHFFRVELIDINDENEELFGGTNDNNLERLIDYLSFVAPVPYQANFVYRSEIYAHAKKLKRGIDEYNIRINGEQIFKKYKTHIKTGNGQDEVFGVQFYEFNDDSNNLLAWMWFGITSFKASIKEEEISRGLRLRKDNIQIGEDDALRGMFAREASKRGNGYFIGEIFAISHELIPNSQRSYFNENPTRANFEHRIKDYFDNTLYHIYYEGSNINSSIKKITDFQTAESEFKKKIGGGAFLTTDEQEREQELLDSKKQEAEKALKNLEKKRTDGRSILTEEIIKRRSSEFAIKTIGDVAKLESDTDKEEDIDTPNETISKQKSLVGSIFSRYSRKERKLLSETLDKIFVIIENATDKRTSETIIARIKEKLR